MRRIGMFNGLTVYLLPTGVGKARQKVLSSQIEKNGGKVLGSFQTDVISHVLVDDDVSSEQLCGFFPDSELVGNLRLVRTKWISACLKHKALLDLEDFQVKLDKNQPHERQAEAPGRSDARRRTRRDSADAELTNDEGANVFAGLEEDPGVSDPKKGRFVCEKSSTDVSSQPPNKNQHITEKLQVLADAYKSTNDRWRALSYEKAIQTLQHLSYRLESHEQVKDLRGIGERLAEKIWEICQSGELRKADEMAQNEKVQVMQLFTNIWGVGPTIAEQWYIQGLRTLDHVRAQAKLTRQQEIGLKYLDELMQRIPRSEAAEIVQVIVDEVAKMDEGLICEVCGSFRRGKSSCGDVDILITHPDGTSHQGVLPGLVRKLSDSGFLTDHLVECQTDGNQKKYMGVCRIQRDGALHRRIDIISVPFSEYATSLIYFTGSAHFTRSIYAKAKSMGMRLNHHGLRGGVMRQHGEKLNDGYPISTPTERSVFHRLGIPYRTPQERDHP